MKNDLVKVNETQMQTLLDTLYDKAIFGIPKVSKSIEEVANDYLSKNDSVEDAIKSFVKYQKIKTATSGFINSLGGIITLPITLPANLVSVLYIQLRMIAIIAYMGGFDVKSDQVQTLAYLCLTGSAVTDILKQAGVKTSQKVGVSLVKKLPSTIIKEINKKVSARLVTKFGEKGIINLYKVIPVLGGIVGGGVDYFSTKAIASKAYNLFIKEKSL